MPLNFAAAMKNELLAATMSTLEFTNQKNAVRGEVVGLGSSDLVISMMPKHYYPCVEGVKISYETLTSADVTSGRNKKLFFHPSTKQAICNTPQNNTQRIIDHRTKGAPNNKCNMKGIYSTALLAALSVGYVEAFSPIASTNRSLKKVRQNPQISAPIHTESKTRKSNFQLHGSVPEEQTASFSYGEFAKQNPFANNIAIATTKTAAADLLAQTVIAHTPIADIDWQRSLLFCAFGAIYLGGFQYLYQVNVFKKLFDVDKFTSLSWADKLKDEEGLKALAAQTALDLTVLTLIYLPTFYIFKAGVFSGTMDPSVWTSTGIENYTNNFAKDEFDLLRVWFPADIVCFSVPLYLRLPVRHVVSFVWTAYLSFTRGGH